MVNFGHVEVFHERDNELSRQTSELPEARRCCLPFPDEELAIILPELRQDIPMKVQILADPDEAPLPDHHLHEAGDSLLRSANRSKTSRTVGGAQAAAEIEGGESLPQIPPSPL
jgi:hypothetical protein